MHPVNRGAATPPNAPLESATVYGRRLTSDTRVDCSQCVVRTDVPDQRPFTSHVGRSLTTLIGV